LDEALAIPMLASSNHEADTDVSTNRADIGRVRPPRRRILRVNRSLVDDAPLRLTGKIAPIIRRFPFPVKSALEELLWIDMRTSLNCA
jgi:hypothetical protein